MTKGADLGKTVQFKAPHGYVEFGVILDSDTQDGESGWIVEYENWDDEGDFVGMATAFVKDSAIYHVVEYHSDGDKELVIYGKVGMPKVTNTEHENGVQVMEVDWDVEPEKLGEITICGDPEGLRDLANFLNEQANILEGIAPEKRGDGYGHAHYRGASGIWPDVVVMPILAQDRKAEEND